MKLFSKNLNVMMLVGESEKNWSQQTSVADH